MKCRYSEHEIALFVEGDLNEPVLQDIQAHLPGCDACSGLVEELRESQSIFKALRQESVSGAALGRVRNRVLAEVAGVSSTTSWGRRVERWLYQGARRGYALAGVGLAVLMLAGLGLWYARKPEPKIQRVVQADPLPPAVAVPLSEGDKNNTQNMTSVIVPLKEGAGRRSRQGVTRTVRAKPAPPAPAPDETPKQLVLKLLTDDPNIVIYWLVDQTGG
jgi:hypothetical protein